MVKNDIWESHLPELSKKKREDLIFRSAGSVRLYLGKYYTQEEYEKKRKKILSIKLP